MDIALTMLLWGQGAQLQLSAPRRISPCKEKRFNNSIKKQNCEVPKGKLIKLFNKLPSPILGCTYVYSDERSNTQNRLEEAL